MDDFVQQNNTCVDCPDGCKVCSEDLTCTECETDWELDGQGGCQCIAGYYKQDKSCLLCMDGCINCTQIEICLTCDTSKEFILDQDTNTCVCSKGFFKD